MVTGTFVAEYVLEDILDPKNYLKDCTSIAQKLISY